MTHNVLMVCTGNICRSVMAQVVLGNEAPDIDVDSAGISDEEQGNPIDYRAVTMLRGAGYIVPEHRARQITPFDLDDFDLILAMTHSHFKAVERMAERSGRMLLPGQLRMYRSFDAEGSSADVPDPWYGDLSNFRETLETVEEVTARLVEFIREQST